jgi:hypothetical protein
MQGNDVKSARGGVNPTRPASVKSDLNRARTQTDAMAVFFMITHDTKQPSIGEPSYS